jgi:NADH:ubiquinone oxidoreductase subunit 2 (subunit N)
VLAVVMSAVSAGFYFRIVRAMFFEASTEDVRVPQVPMAAAVVIAACCAAVLAMGIAAGPLLSAIAFAAK